MRKAFVIALLLGMISITVYALAEEDPPVFTDADLQKYKYKGDDSSAQYNRQIIHRNRQEQEYRDFHRETEGMQKTLDKEISETKEKQDALSKALDKERQELNAVKERVAELERERTQKTIRDRDRETRIPCSGSHECPPNLLWCHKEGMSRTGYCRSGGP